MQVNPDYRKSVYNIPHSVLSAFGAKSAAPLTGLTPSRDRLVLILIDALGANLVRRVLGREAGWWQELTSVFPSTTSAAVTTVFTGLSPKEHGVLEWYMRYECTGTIIKTIPFEEMEQKESLIPRCDPATLFGHETIFQKLSKNEIKSSAYIKKEYLHSPYSQFMTAGAKRVGYSGEEDLPSLLRKESADFIYIYIDTLDVVQHRFGPMHKKTEETLRKIWKIASQIRNTVHDAEIWIIADHGQTEVKKKDILSVPDGCPVGGSPRDMFVYCPEIIEGYGSLSKSEFLELLGPGQPAESLHERVPHHIIMPPEHTGVWFRDFIVTGLHGGMSEDEMLVPLVIW